MTGALALGAAALVMCGVAPSQVAVGAAPDPGAWLRVIGRLHPAFVHFPIGLIVVAGVLEAARVARRGQRPSPAALACLLLGVPLAGAAIVAGLLNDAYEPHAAAVAGLIDWHQWSAYTAGGLSLVALVFGLAASRAGAWSRRLYVGGLLAGAGVAGYTGYLGDSIVRGEGHLMEPFRAPGVRGEDPVRGAAPAGWSDPEIHAVRALRALGARVEPAAVGSADLDLNLSLAGPVIDDGALAVLRVLGARVVTLDLSRTRVTDSGLSALAPCTRVRALNLTECAIGDEGLDALLGLERLEVLNLVGTRVSDAGLLRLARVPGLRRVYVWRTGVTPEGVELLRRAADRVEVISVSEPLSADPAPK